MYLGVRCLNLRILLQHITCTFDIRDYCKTIVLYVLTTLV
jgi:hypothetical protein